MTFTSSMSKFKNCLNIIFNLVKQPSDLHLLVIALEQGFLLEQKYDHLKKCKKLIHYKLFRCIKNILILFLVHF
jgi:hypothetical protein